MAVDLNSIIDQVTQLLQQGTDQEMHEFLLNIFPEMLNEIQELRQRVQFLEIDKTALEIELSIERGEDE